MLVFLLLPFSYKNTIFVVGYFLLQTPFIYFLISFSYRSTFYNHINEVNYRLFYPCNFSLHQEFNNSLPEIVVLSLERGYTLRTCNEIP